MSVALRPRPSLLRPVGAAIWRLDTVEVHLATVDLAQDADLEAAAAVLSPAERAYAARGTAEVSRRRVLLRAALRELLGEHTGLAPALVPLAGRPGRPTWAPGSPYPDLDLGCSASGDLGLVAVARGARIGVDVQQHLDEHLADAVAEGWLSRREHLALAALPVAEQAAAITRCWAQKEALAKGSGLGLRADLAALETPLADRGRAGAWQLHPVDVPPGYTAALALRPTGARLHRSAR